VGPLGPALFYYLSRPEPAFGSGDANQHKQEPL
jgi:hypothetical protein